MTRIIEFLIALGIVAGLFVIIGVCLPGERHITESIETNRKMTIVYDTVSSLRRFKDWNPLVLRDPAVELKLSGPASGVGATLDFTSKDLGTGSWKITEAEENKRVAIAIDDATKGHDKITTFTLEPTGKGGRNVKITQDYSVKVRLRPVRPLCRPVCQPPDRRRHQDGSVAYGQHAGQRPERGLPHPGSPADRSGHRQCAG